MPRIFLGLWPNDATRSALDTCAADMHAKWGGRRTNVDRLHLTLAFLGEIDEQRIDFLVQCLEHVPTPAYHFILDRFGHFGDAGWIGCSTPAQELETQSRLCRAACRLNGFATDETPFVPHVTLVRHVRQHEVALNGVEIPWSAQGFVLAEAADKPGETYRIRARFGTKM